MFPKLFEYKDFVLYSYPFFMGLAWGFPLLYCWKFLKLRKQKIDFVFYFFFVFVLAWIGAKVLFILAIPPHLHDMLTDVNFWRGGGFVFYGGLVGGIFAHILWVSFKKSSFDYTFLIPALCLGHGIGRLGCFFTGCCFGKSMGGLFLFPTQIVESLFLFGLFLFLNKKISQGLRTIFSLYALYYGTFRFLIEFLRDDEIRGSFYYLSTSQWISLILVLTGLIGGQAKFSRS
ncbi:MAG: prolipoprotein diacylglyceryl transferase [Halobacteriovoraceae bacterium]|nr:prolipoprotein diacylglyceryl transferase [Halobacteriovoraceae bacterium]